jgi:3-oxoacyl-[acyl-carrier-protein] synthase II
MGMVTALGADLEVAWSRALAGESGVRPVSSFEAGSLPIAGAGEVSKDEI